jgi:hypothetical protein
MHWGSMPLGSMHFGSMHFGATMATDGTLMATDGN